MPLVVNDFNEICNEYFRELFYHVDIENQEITEPSIAKYNLKVKNLLLEIQTDYGFRLCCHDIEYDDVAVGTTLFKIPVRRSSAPLVQQTNNTVNLRTNFQSHPTPLIVSLTGPAHLTGRHGRRYIGWKRWPTSRTGVNTTAH